MPDDREQRNGREARDRLARRMQEQSQRTGQGTGRTFADYQREATQVARRTDKKQGR